MVELTERETYCLRAIYLLMLGNNRKEAAEKLHLSYRTIESHVYHLMIKFSAKNIVHLIGILLSNDLLVSFDGESLLFKQRKSSTCSLCKNFGIIRKGNGGTAFY